MKLSEHIGSLVREHKEQSIDALRFLEHKLIPQTLSTFLSIKSDENLRAAQSPLASHHAKKGRSPAKGSKGHKLLLSKEKELAADRRLKRYNIITLLDKLHEAMNGVKN